MSDVYDRPEYYEIAFAFRDIPHEVDVFEESIRRHSKVPVHTFLELGCGSAPHMPELLKRGYGYIGLDIKGAMLAHAQSKVPPASSVTLFRADMCHFTIDQPAQFAFVALGSLFAPSTADLLNHFRCVAQAIEHGGLYLLDWCVQFAPVGAGNETWTRERGDIRVQTTVSWRTVDPIEQLSEETIDIDVKDGDVLSECSTSCTFRVMFPQEFLLLVHRCTDFQFVGWWNDWNLNQPLKPGIKINRPIVLLMRR